MTGHRDDEWRVAAATRERRVEVPAVIARFTTPVSPTTTYDLVRVAIDGR